MPDPEADCPWLEYYGPKGSMPEKTLLEELPFTIGRGESADLQINSARVSREHAVILRSGTLQDGEEFVIRDLGSTNGTWLNGQQIDEAALIDGDVLMIANVEFGFMCRSSRVARTTVTQVMAVGQSGADQEGLSQGIIRAVRRLQEVTTQRSIRILFEPIVNLTGGRPMGYEAVDEDEGRNQVEAQHVVLSTECRLTGRLRRLRRLVAAEEATGLPEGVFLFVALDSSEMGSDRLLESLGKLCDVVLSGGRRLVVELPEGAASDVPHCLKFRSRLRELAIGIAYDDFSAGGGKLLQQTQILPDFVKLSRSLVRGLHDDPEHQRQIQSIVNVGRQLGCEIIAAGVATKDDAGICRKLGCRFGQGNLFGTPRPAGSLHVTLQDGPAAVSMGGVETPARLVASV